MEKSFYVYMQQPETLLKPCEHFIDEFGERKDTSTRYGWASEFFKEYQPVWKILYVLSEMVNDNMDEEYDWLLEGHWDSKED